MIEIRRALPDMADRLGEIARAAKASWGYPARWLELWREELTIPPEFIAAHPVFVALVGERVVGCAALVAESETRWALEHVWVDPPEMRRGIGGELVRFASGYAAARGVRELSIDADPFAEPFYLRLGAQKVGEAVGTLDGQPRIRPQLVLALGEASSRKENFERPSGS